MSGTVYLVGAGCGDPELITWKGLNLLRKCDVVLYDDLVASKLLEETKKDCELLFVGKRYGRHSLPQNETNALLVKKAKEGKMVVRLKGGDPFVFGRGGEEVLALQAEGIPYEVVSGVTSSIAVPAAAGIPVTHRKIARSFHELDKMCDEALMQIEERQYGEQLLEDCYEKVIKYGIAFCGKSCKIKTGKSLSCC